MLGLPEDFKKAHGDITDVPIKGDKAGSQIK